MPENLVVGLTADFLVDGQLVYKDIGLGVLEREPGVDVRFLARHEPVVPAELLEGVNALICLTPRITAETLSRSERLGAVMRFGVGYDTVDVRACTEAGVALFITKGAANHSVAEAALGWMLALGHHLIRKDRMTREGRWADRLNWMGSEIGGRVVGIIGLGGIGGRLAELVRPFGPARILACDPYIPAERAASLGAGVVSREELMRSSDYVVVTCPLTDETRGSIGATELGWMKPSAYFINIARGGIVDEEALLEVLRARAIAGAATDVFASEPAGSGHPFYELDNIIVAPHSIAWTDEFFERMGVMCCRQAVSLFDGVIPEGLVNVEVLDRPAFTKKLERFKEARRRV